MKKIFSTAELKEAIRMLEIKRANEAVLLKAQFNSTYDSIRPVNLIKSTVHELAATPDFKRDLLNAGISILSGYLAKKMVVDESDGPLKKIFGMVLQFVVTNTVSKNSEGIKSMFFDLVTGFSTPKNEPG